VDGEPLPGWWTANGPNDRLSRRWPGGHGSPGIAHGIAGPLALLSTAMRRGVTVTGHADAIERICDWLEQWRGGTRSRPWWPGMISLREWKARTLRQPGPQRPSWCYGTPGLARAQQLAALALADEQRQRRAENILAGCVTDDTQLAQLGDASLCHGWAGLIQTTRRAAVTTGADSELAVLLPHLYACMKQHLHQHGHQPTTGSWRAQRASLWLDTPPWLTRRQPPSGTPACCSTADDPVLLVKINELVFPPRDLTEENQ
ncbi:MAG: lanthionine synthetase LanC family protein, partial [Pseudonocardiaceae bacterium]